MMQSITNPDGSKLVILTGRAAESIVNNFKRNPPPFDCINYKPASFFDAETRTTEPLFNADEGAIFDRLNREVEHYRGLEAAKSRLYEEQCRQANEMRAVIQQQEQRHQAELDQASAAIENLRAELVSVNEQMKAIKAPKKPGRKPKALPAASLNGTHKRKVK